MKPMLNALLLTAVLATPGAALADDGAALYKKWCASCHGPEGKNGKATALAGIPEDVIMRNIKTHPSSMKTFGLSAEQMKSIATYLAGLKK